MIKIAKVALHEGIKLGTGEGLKEGAKEARKASPVQNVMKTIESDSLESLIKQFDSSPKTSDIDSVHQDIHQPTDLFAPHGFFADFIQHHLDSDGSDASPDWHVIQDDFPPEYTGGHLSLFAAGSEKHAQGIGLYLSHHNIPSRVCFSPRFGHSTEQINAQGSAPLSESRVSSQGFINVFVPVSRLNINVISNLKSFLSNQGLNGYITWVNEKGEPECILVSAKTG